MGGVSLMGGVWLMGGCWWWEGDGRDVASRETHG